MNCYEVEERLTSYLKSPKGLAFVRRQMPLIDNWPDWDYEAVLTEHAATVSRSDEYWWTLSWRHGSMGINANDEVIARKSAAVFIELFNRGFSCSFADNLAHGFAMWLELQNQRHLFELTKDLGNATLKMNSWRYAADMSEEEMAAWTKLVDTAKLLKEREQ
jgi:hypothetical protein